MHEFLFEMVTALVFTLKYEDSYYRRRNVIKTPVRYNYREEGETERAKDRHM